MAAYETVIVDRHDELGIVTFNRPQRMNAIDYTMRFEIIEAFNELNADPAIGAIILTGAGRGFCAGADVSRFEEMIRESDGEKVEHPRPQVSWLDLARTSKPIVCAINGPSIGEGLTRTLCCDVRLASTRASFSMRFVRMGLVPEIASTQLLPQVVGLQVATDLMLSGRTIDASEAARIGLVLRTLEPDELMPEAERLAREYAANGEQALLAVKRLLTQNSVEQNLELVGSRERDELEKRYGSPEQREAVAAFREKRDPIFRKLNPR